MELSYSGLVLIGYMAVLLLIGVYASKSASSGDAFLIADRQLGPIIAGLAYAASSSSAWVLLGFTAFVASSGVSALWMVPGILVGYAAVWFGVGPFLQEAARREKWVSAVDILAADMTDGEARFLRPLAAMIVAFCFVFYIAAQLQASGVAIADVFSLNINLAIIISVLIVFIYTLFGGFLAVSLTDMLQGLSIAVVAVILPIAVLANQGGVDTLLAGASEANLSDGSAFAGHMGFALIGFLVGVSSIGFGALGQPHLLAWVMSVKDRSSRLTGGVVAILWAALVYAGMTVIGLVMSQQGAALDQGERLLLFAAGEAASPMMVALLTAAIISAIMSTIDSQLLVASGVISRDLIARRAASISEVSQVRLIIGAICILSVLLAFYLPATIFERVLFAWTALGAAFGPIVVFRACKLSQKPGVTTAAMLVGFGVAVGASLLEDKGPGAWLERTAPWMLAGIILFFGRKRSNAPE